MATKIRPLEETYIQEKYIRCGLRQKNKNCIWNVVWIALVTLSVMFFIPM